MVSRSLLMVNVALVYRGAVCNNGLDGDAQDGRFSLSRLEAWEGWLCKPATVQLAERVDANVRTQEEVMSLDVYLREVRMTTIYDANITHNLSKMAEEAGIYKHLWRPEEIEITTAQQLIAPLREGLALLLRESERFKKFDPENKWGDYSELVDFVRSYLSACEDNPDAEVSVSR